MLGSLEEDLEIARLGRRVMNRRDDAVPPRLRYAVREREVALVGPLWTRARVSWCV